MKTQENPSARPCGHILHTYPDLYILISYQPKGSESNYVRASCEAVEEGNPQAGNGLSIYLSPFDAYLAAAYVSKPGNPFHAIPAADFDPRELIRDSGGKFHTALHCGWGANNGRLVIRRDGSIASLCGLTTLDVPPRGMDAIDLRIEEDDLSAYDGMREKAGLFAHSETHDAFLGLNDRARQKVLARAIHSIPGTVDVGHEINQLAIYDPEAAQWHFLPISVFYERTDESQRSANK
ncbi:hypothetical protein [Cupriavidus basilensis]|uniref:hypothetical protein n=1 Tax=Cupriavidus basilensis TaxID=68895 RepID=UPI0023E76609|nr:hypothetical protein [Cupriavidus basilensis]MDF3887595.1 hypothetical protein [Cupriavidus basilensis]